MNSPESILKDAGFYAAAVHGVSMIPLLCNHRDTVYVEPATVFHKRDVVLFRRRNRQLVLHRLIRVKGDYLIVSGDNELTSEVITREQVLGVMTAFTRKGRTVYTSSPLYRIYSYIWTVSFPTKRIFIRLYHWMTRKRRRAS